VSLHEEISSEGGRVLPYIDDKVMKDCSKKDSFLGYHGSYHERESMSQRHRISLTESSMFFVTITVIKFKNVFADASMWGTLIKNIR